MEIWKEIEGYEGLYQISNQGAVKSLGNGGSNASKEKILKPTKDKKGYLIVCLCKQGKHKHHKIHRLVAMAFIPNPDNLPQVNHINEIKTDNRVENLEWCDCQYNVDYSQSKQVLCIETGIVYPSTMEVQRQLGFAHTHISSACNGRLKQAYGFHWKYV